jgi:hypothetical protein
LRFTGESSAFRLCFGSARFSRTRRSTFPECLQLHSSVHLGSVIMNEDEVPSDTPSLVFHWNHQDSRLVGSTAHLRQ